MTENKNHLGNYSVLLYAIFSQRKSAMQINTE